jgi:hypothetical protein
MSISNSCYIPISFSDLVALKGIKKLPDNSSSINGNCDNNVNITTTTNILNSLPTAITVVGDTNAGSSPTITISTISNNIYGRIQVVIGSAPSGSLLCKINLTTKYSFGSLLLNAFNSTCATYNLYGVLDNSGSNSVINVYTNTTTTASQTLIFNYCVFGK